jgi:hypothetical protein
VPVQAGPRAVVAHRGARVGVGGGFLHVAQRDPGVEGGGDERVPKRVRADVLGDPGAPGDPADGAGGAVPAQPFPVRGDEEGSFGALADNQVDRTGGARGEGDGDDLAALAGDDQGPVPAFQAQVLDVPPVASDTGSLFSASKEISACSAGGPSPAATRSAPSSLRSRAVACDS